MFIINTQLVNHHHLAKQILPQRAVAERVDLEKKLQFLLTKPRLVKLWYVLN